MLNIILKIIMLTVFLTMVFLSCKDEDFEKKVDPALKLQLKHLNESSRLDENIAVVFKVTEPLTDAHEAFLKEKKIKIAAHIGPIYTASVPARTIYDLSKMKFIETIQSSRTLKTTPADSLNTIKKF